MDNPILLIAFLLVPAVSCVIMYFVCAYRKNPKLVWYSLLISSCFSLIAVGIPLMSDLQEFGFLIWIRVLLFTLLINVIFAFFTHAIIEATADKGYELCLKIAKNKKYIILFLFAAIVITTPIIVIVNIPSVDPNAVDITDSFECEDFLAEVRRILGKRRNAPIYDVDVRDIQELPDFQPNNRGPTAWQRTISSVAGIEHFTSLQSLELWSNPLYSIDVSKNHKLIKLYVNNTQISELDLSGNPNLRRLYAANNYLTELDLSSNKNLASINIRYNQLTKLDVSNNTLLHDLDVDANELYEIELANTPNLSHFSAKHNRLTDIDFSDSYCLISIDVGWNELTALDVSNNPSLDSIHVNNNALTELDLSYNHTLQTIDAAWNRLTQVKLMDIQSDSTLIRLYFRNNLLTLLDISKLPDVELLDVRWNNMTAPDNIIGLNEHTMLLVKTEAKPMGQNKGLWFWPQGSY